MASINYVVAAANYSPGIGFSSYSVPTNYESLVWQGTPIDKAVLENYWYGFEKQRILQGLVLSMRTAVAAGVQSDVLSPGTMRKYNTDIQAQIALIGARLYTIPTDSNPSGRNFSIPSYDIATSLGQIDSYSYTQIETLFNTFAEYSQTMFNKLQAKAGFINAIDATVVSTALDVLYAVTWTSVE